MWELESGQKPEFLMEPTHKPDASVWVVRDAAGNSYAWNGNWEVQKKSQILKRSAQGATQVLAGSEWGIRGRARRARVRRLARQAFNLQIRVQRGSLLTELAAVRRETEVQRATRAPSNAANTQTTFERRDPSCPGYLSSNSEAAFVVS